MRILQLQDHPEVFVTGDAAAAASAPDAAQVAPVAMSQGELAAANVEHLLRGAPLEEFRYSDKGMLVSLGMNYAVVSIGRVRFSGYFAWLFWNAVHLYKLVGLKKQLQVGDGLGAGNDFSARYFDRAAASGAAKFADRRTAEPAAL